MKYIPLFFLLIGFSACSPKLKSANGTKAYAFHFVESEQLKPVLEQARAKDKLVFVDFYTSWCLPCRLMEEDVFTDRDLAKYVNENFISCRIDAEKGNGVNLAMIYEVSAYPTLLFLDGNGQVLARKVGAAFQTEFRQLAEEARRAKVK